MTTMFVLVAIWTSGYKGSEIIVPGFTTLESCQIQGNELMKSHRMYDTFHCVEVK